jgi:hypothetical protein
MGWAPASYLSNEDDFEETMTIIKYEPGKGKKMTNYTSIHYDTTIFSVIFLIETGENFVSTRAYKAELEDELSFDVGVHLQVIEKNLDGWWRAM